MTKVKKILCIYPEPDELRIAALLNRHGIAVDLVEAATREKLGVVLEQPQWWDVVLCDELAYEEFTVAERLYRVRNQMDASLVLIQSPDSTLVAAEAYRRGAVDVVCRGDMDHLLMVCEREIRNCAARKQLRQMRTLADSFDAESTMPFVFATVKDLSKTLKERRAVDDPQAASAMISLEPERIRRLIDAGGLTLEYQPIISFKAGECQRNMFEALVRLRDEQGAALTPDHFLSAAAIAGWMGRIDLWVFRQSIATLKAMQDAGVQDAVLFVNLAHETLRSVQQIKAIGAFVHAARLVPGSLVVEVRKSIFFEGETEGMTLLHSILQQHHGLLIEDLHLGDCEFLREHAGRVSHVKLSREIIHSLVAGSASQGALNGFVRCAHQLGVRVIALGVDDVGLLPMLAAAGVDSIQGNFMGMPNQDLVYPSIEHVGMGGNA